MPKRSSTLAWPSADNRAPPLRWKRPSEAALGVTGIALGDFKFQSGPVGKTLMVRHATCVQPRSVRGGAELLAPHGLEQRATLLSFREP